MTQNMSICNDTEKDKNTLETLINTDKNFFEKIVDTTPKNGKRNEKQRHQHPRNAEPKPNTRD